MRDQDQGAVEHAQRTLELLDEMVRRLVEHEAPRSARRLERELGPRPLAGQRLGAERPDQRFVRGEQRPRLPDFAEDHRRADPRSRG